MGPGVPIDTQIGSNSIIFASIRVLAPPGNLILSLGLFNNSEHNCPFIESLQKSLSKARLWETVKIPWLLAAAVAVEGLEETALLQVLALIPTFAR